MWEQASPAPTVDLSPALLFFAALRTPIAHGLEELFIDLMGVQQHTAHQGKIDLLNLLQERVFIIHIE